MAWRFWPTPRQGRWAQSCQAGQPTRQREQWHRERSWGIVIAIGRWDCRPNTALFSSGSMMAPDTAFPGAVSDQTGPYQAAVTWSAHAGLSRGRWRLIVHYTNLDAHLLRMPMLNFTRLQAAIKALEVWGRIGETPNVGLSRMGKSCPICYYIIIKISICAGIDGSSHRAPPGGAIHGQARKLVTGSRWIASQGLAMTGDGVTVVARVA